MRQLYRPVLALLLVQFFGLVIASATVSAALLDVSVGTGSVVFKATDNVTISGYVRTTLGVPVASAAVQVYVDGTLIETVQSNADGKYNCTPFAASTPGTHTVSVTATKTTDVGYVYGSYIVQTYEKSFTIKTNKYSYTPGQIVYINFFVSYVLSNGSYIQAGGVDFTYKIKNTNGTVVKDVTTLTTDAAGEVSANYSIPDGGYGSYMIMVDNGFAIDSFEVPPFSITAVTQGVNGEDAFNFGTSDSVMAKVTATRKTESNQTVPVTQADVTAILKDSVGTTKYTFTNFTESSAGGVYTSETYSLANLTNGDYYIDMYVTKSELTKTQRVWFKIQTLKLDFAPFTEMNHVIGFLKGQSVSLGMMAINMLTGQEVSSNQILNASITGCKSASGKDCSSSLAGSGSLQDGFANFAKVLRFTAPNETGEYNIQIQATVNTSTGQLTGTGTAFISVQNIIAFAETKDQFDNMRFDYGPGQRVKIQASAYGGNWSPESIASLQIVEMRDKDWNNITSSFNFTVAGNTVEFDAPETSGFYQLKLKITTSGGDVGYAAGSFMVRLYNIFVDTMDGSSDSASWKWKYGSNDAVYFRFNVMEMSGTRVTATNLKVQADALVSDMTQKRYTGLNVTELSTDSIGRPGLMLNLSGLSLQAGPYHAEFQIKDTDGNTEMASMWFKISNLNLWVDTKDSQGAWKWRYGPTDNITFWVNAYYFNGTQVPSATVASVEGLYMMKDGPPIKVASTLYSTSNQTNVSGGTGISWAKAAQGKTLPQSFYMTAIKVTLPDGTSDTQEAWFEVSVMDINAYADPSSVSPSGNVSIKLQVKKSDGTALEGATVALYKLRNMNTWTEVTLPSFSPVNTSSEGAATLSFPATSLNGNYEAELKVTSSTLGATAVGRAWFEVKQYKITGWPVDGSKTAYQPEETVEMWVKVEYPNSTWSSPQYVTGATVSVYKFANTESWPWNYVESVDMVQSGTTDSQGTCKIKFKAPSDAGLYSPMAQLNSNYNSTSAWEISNINVRSASVLVSLFDNSTGSLVSTDKFSTGANVTVEINVSNPAGGEVNVTGIALKYKDLSSDAFTNLQTLSYGLGANNYASFTTPSTEGDYVVYVTVTDGSTGRTLPAEKRWFKVQTFEVRFWMEQWSLSPGQNASVNFNALAPGGGAANFTVELEEVRNAWSWTTVNLSYDDGAKNITGNGAYVFTVPSVCGEYEVMFCSYAQGLACSASSQRQRLHINVETFRVDTWPTKASFTTAENATLNVEARFANGTTIGPSTYNATLIELKNSVTWESKIHLITVPSAANDGTRKTFPINATNLTVGDYMARINVTTSSESRVRDAWFKISDAEITVRTVPQVDNRNRDRWLVGENITLNVSISPAQTGTIKMKLMDDYGWREVASYEYSITGSYRSFTITVNQSSRYSAIIKIGSAEAFYWFEVGAYQIDVSDSQSTHELRRTENVSVVFDVKSPDGSQYNGTVGVYVRRLRNPWDWSPVAGTDNMFSANLTAGSGSESFNFSHGQSSGEYDTEIEFLVENRSTMRGFWFMIRDNLVEARPWQRTYAPGATAHIDVWVGYPNRTAISGANVTILAVKDRRYWTDVPVTYLNRSNLTGASGVAMISFGLPANTTGTFDVKFNVSAGSSSQVAFTELSVSGYDAWFERSGNLWSYSPGQSLNGTVKVFDSNNNPVNGTAVAVIARNQQWNALHDVGVSGSTGIDGAFAVSLPLNAGNFTPGDYSLEIDIGGGTATIRDIWFKVETFRTKVNMMKESSGTLSSTDNFGTSDTIVVEVQVLDANGGLVSSRVNSSLVEVRSMPFGDNVTGNFTTLTDTLPQENGVTRVKLNQSGSLTGEFTIRVNVTGNISGVVASNTVDAWARVKEYELSLSFACPPGAGSNCDPRRATSGGTLRVNVTMAGTYSTFRVCMGRIRDIYTGRETNYGTQYCVTNSTYLLAFPAPTATGDYDAVFDITVNGQMSGDRGEFFRVGGAYDMNSWVEPNNVYAGQNATMWVQIWGPGWSDINESTCSISITEMRNARTWQTISTNLTYWNRGPGSEMDPPGIRLVFTVPSTLAPSDYMVKSQAVCNSSTMTGEGWFRVVIFQVASLLDQKLKSNTSTQMWLKVMNGSSGAPLTGATVRLDKLFDQFSGTVLQMYNWSTTTDANGEVLIPFTTPTNPGQYFLKSTIIYGTQTQEVDKSFQISSMDVKITMLQEKFFMSNGNVNIIIYVNVTDPLSGSAPIVNANAQLQLWAFSQQGGPAPGGEPMVVPLVGGGSQSFSTQTNASGIATFVLNSTVYNFSAGNYEANVNVNTPDRGGTMAMKTVMIRKYNMTVSGLSATYSPGGAASFNVNLKYPNGTALVNKTVMTLLSAMKMSGGNETTLNMTIGRTNATGYANFVNAIPSNASSGPTFAVILVGDDPEQAEDEEEYMFVIGGAGTVTYQNVNSSGVLPGQFIDVNVTCANASLVLGPSVMHLEKTGGAVPISQMKSGGPDSGKETYYENSILFNGSGFAHIKVLAQRQPGNYLILQPLMVKGTSMSGNANFEDLGVMEYKVL